MPSEPLSKRAGVFIDGQNLFHAAREAFGYTYPNYDVRALAERVCAGRGWQLARICFYTGIPDREDDARWHDFWSAKLAVMGRQDIHVYSRALRYRNRTLRLPDGSEHTILTGEEKGIDVRLAVDVIRTAHRQEYDVAVLFSQDQDLSEERTRSALSLLNRRGGSRSPARSLRVRRAGTGVASTRPTGFGPTGAMYDACLDRRDYRRRPGGGSPATAG